MQNKITIYTENKGISRDTLINQNNNICELSSTSKDKLQEFYINDNYKNEERYHYKNNYISTTKYNVITFLPKSILLQFTRLPNIYFLICAIIQDIPLISPLNSLTAILPLLFVLGVSMIRELIEDITRYKYDKMNNDEIVYVYRQNHFIKAKSSSLRIGEVIVLFDNSIIPCDMVLIDSSLNDGICYVETSSLDGEKSLKQKIANIATSGIFSLMCKNLSIEELGNFKVSGFCQCDYPNPDLNNLEGKVNFNINKINLEFPISTNQLLLKSSIIKQTSWVIGYAIYTGLHNKILLNSKMPRMKISKIERLMSKFLYVIFIIQMLMCLICSINHSKKYESHHLFYNKYIPLNESHSTESVLSFFTYLLLLNTLIPISLIITLEIVKIAQGFFIKWDIGLYSKYRNKYCKASSVSLNEELGNVTYIFSDKTGTLTYNKMNFKYCVIGETCYEYSPNQTGNNKENNIINISNKSNEKPKDDLTKIESKDLILLEDKNELNSLNKLNAFENRMKIIPFGKNYFGNLIEKTKPTSYSTKGTNLQKKMNMNIETIDHFWRAISVSHECECSQTENGNEYSGASPDDVELVKTASNQGYSFMKAPNNNIRKISIAGKEYEFEVLKILNFTSVRKRMSIIIKEGNVIKLYSKGADCEISKRLSKKSSKSYYSFITQCIEYFSGKGFRTLMIAERTLKNNEYESWNAKLRKSEMNLSKKKELIELCYNEIERDLFLLGATVVEDKLQENVPETIRDLRLAGIKIWVLTGDKIKTAENIALSCNLISNMHKNFKIVSSKTKQDTLMDAKKVIYKFIEEFRDFAFKEEENILSLSNEHINRNFLQNKGMGMTPFSLLIEGTILTSLLRDSTLKEQFLRIAIHANTVLCCRVSPLQKSKIVKIVKEYDKSAITLAIGDGGNDVSMIMEAHIGVGLYGEEGLRAVQASDFAIGEFQYLRRLLFLHGRTNSNRISQMILYFFYKNIVFTMNHFLFSFYCLSSGQTIIDDWFITFYNLIFTALPLGVQGCSDFDIKEEDHKTVWEMMPFLYKESRDIPIFSFKHFLFHLLKGLFFGSLNFYFLLFSIKESPIDQKGYYEILWFDSLAIYTNIIIGVSITLILNTRFITFLIPLIMGVFSFASYIAFCLFVHYSSLFNSHAAILPSFSSVKLYLNIILFCGFCFIIDYAKESAKFIFGNYISTKLMILNNERNFNISNLPTIVSNAKKNIELIMKYNNYNIVQKNNVSNSEYLFIGKNRELIRQLKKSRTQNDIYMKKMFSLNTDSEIIVNTNEKLHLGNISSVKEQNKKGFQSDIRVKNNFKEDISFRRFFVKSG